MLSAKNDVGGVNQETDAVTPPTEDNQHHNSTTWQHHSDTYHDSDETMEHHHDNKAKYCNCQINYNIWLLLYLPVYMIYLSVGALIFMQTEGIVENVLRARLKLDKQEFLDAHSCVTDNELERLIGEVLEASKRGVSVTSDREEDSNWTFGQSFFFAFTIITTIGYGQVHPLSEGGKMFCILYAVIGIPMTFILLTALVDRLMLPSNALLNWLHSKLDHSWKWLSIRALHLLLMVSLTTLLAILFPALIFNSIEPGWGFLDSVYYCFISLTTIGLGDYIPGDSPNQQMRLLYKIITTIYLLIGLSLVVLLLRLYSHIPQFNLGRLLRQSPDAAADPEKIQLVSSKSYNSLTAINSTQ